jgi:hypothetical protein
MTAITKPETADLARLERIIERGMPKFREVGEALAQIRDQRLYREKWGTFEEYVKQRWNWTRQRAYHLIDAAAVAAELPAECQPVVDTERKARAVKAQQRKEAEPEPGADFNPEPPPEPDSEIESPHVQTLAQIAEAEAEKTREILDQIRGIVRAAGQFTVENRNTVRLALGQAAEELE